MSAQTDFRIGDVVYLKNGTRTRFIVENNKHRDGLVLCLWMRELQVEHYPFHPDMLIKDDDANFRLLNRHYYSGRRQQDNGQRDIRRDDDEVETINP